jgi:hypothetical protein
MPLLLVTQESHAAVVKLLLDTNKADVNAKTGDGWTPLLFAAGMGNTNVLRSLLNTGRANADARGPYQRTPLCWAVLNRHEAVVQLLLDIDAINVNAKDINGSTPLLWAVQNRCLGIVTSLSRWARSICLSKTEMDGNLWRGQNKTIRLRWWSCYKHIIRVSQFYRSAVCARHGIQSRRTGARGGRAVAARLCGLSSYSSRRPPFAAGICQSFSRHAC